MLGRLLLGLLLLALLVGCGGKGDSEEAAVAEQPPAATEQAGADTSAAGQETQPTEPEAAATGPTTTATEPEAPPADRKALEAVVRAWSKALNAGDNEAAADLFAPGALIVQGGFVIQLEDHEDAVIWNESLPCSGRIVDIAIAGEIVTAVFVLGDRPASQCDAPPGTRAAAQFLIRGGKILLWQQIPPPESLEPGTGTEPAAPSA